jgi:hypothetical protein
MHAATQAAAALAGAQARHDAAYDRSFDDDSLTPDQAKSDAKDEIDRTGYVMGWALMELCVTTVEPPVSHDTIASDDLHAPSMSSQQLLVVLLHGDEHAMRAARSELLDRIRARPSTQEAIADRAAELLAEAVPA